MARLSAGLGLLFLVLVAFLTWLSLEFIPASGFFPVVRIEVAPGIQLEYLLSGHGEAPGCQMQIAVMRAAVSKSCPSCRIASECRRGLEAGHRRALSGETLDTTSLRIRGGVLLVYAEDAATAMQICAGARVSQTTDSSELCTAPRQLRSRWRL